MPCMILHTSRISILKLSYCSLSCRFALIELSSNGWQSFTHIRLIAVCFSNVPFLPLQYHSIIITLGRDVRDDCAYGFISLNVSIEKMDNARFNFEDYV